MDPALLEDWFNEFDPADHLLPIVSRDEFESLRSWDFGWLILKGISIAEDEDEEVALAKRFSPAQKALYFFWYLDGQVVNGGFMQFFLNGYLIYSQSILTGLELVGDPTSAKILQDALDDCWKHKGEFELVAAGKEEWSWLRERLPEMGRLDDAYLEHHDRAMALFELYIRSHPEKFVCIQ
ncbi:MAG: DUF4375 domain-containing protein [Flavobacteriales bacterium]|nr:DUF4375 domain-containing protein [Flavobacteriales bacterium]